MLAVGQAHHIQLVQVFIGANHFSVEEISHLSRWLTGIEIHPGAQIALLWQAIEKLSNPVHNRDCVPKDAALEEHFEADKLNQLVGK